MTKATAKSTKAKTPAAAAKRTPAKAKTPAKKTPTKAKTPVRSEPTTTATPKSKARGRGKSSTSVLSTLSSKKRGKNTNDDEDELNFSEDSEDDIYNDGDEDSDDDEVVVVSQKTKAVPKTKTNAKAQVTIKSKATTTKKATTKTAKSKLKSKEGPTIIPIPRGWPVSSFESYPAPQQQEAPPETSLYSNVNIDDDAIGNAESTTQNQSTAPSNYLKPGNLLQQSCNGSDVFLRKRAVQTLSMAFPSNNSATAVGNSSNSNKGGPARFLILFPGRLSLKAPEIPSNINGSSNCKNGEDGNDDALKEEDDVINNEEKGTNVNGRAEATTKKARNPFAPANPPQLLGKLVSLGGDERRMELRVPFHPTSDTSLPENVLSSTETAEANDSQLKQQQLIFSGRAIPLSGKYMALTFKRTGGGKADSTTKTIGSNANKKKGTGSIMCKDIFRSVIVLGESKLLANDDEKKVVEAKKDGDEIMVENGEDFGEKPVPFHHYGGSERTLDGGGKYRGGGVTGRKSTGGGKATKPHPKSSQSEEDYDDDNKSENEISLTSDDDKDEIEDDEDIAVEESDDEFVPTSSKKRGEKRKNTGRKSVGDAKEKEEANDDEEEEPKRRERTPRRSAIKAKSVNYADEDSDVDVNSESDDDDNSEEEKGDPSSNDEQSEKDDSDDEFWEKMKKVRQPAKKQTPKKVADTKKKAVVAKKPANIPASQKKTTKSAKKADIVVIESDDDAAEGNQSGNKRRQSSSPKSATKVNITVTANKTDMKKRASTARKGKNTASKETKEVIDIDSAPSTPVKSKMSPTKTASNKRKTSVFDTPTSPSPRKRKKTSSGKSPTSLGKKNELDINDDSFNFLG